VKRRDNGKKREGHRELKTKKFVVLTVEKKRSGGYL